MHKLKPKNRNRRADGERALSVSIVRFSEEAARQLVDIIGRKRRKPARQDEAGDRDGHAAARENRARVVAALRKLHDRVGLSVPKAVRRLRVNPTWRALMKGVADRSWASYYYEK